MTAPDFTNDDLWALLMLLRHRYEEIAEKRARCRRHVDRPDNGEMFRGYVADYDAELAQLDAVAGKFPERMRDTWERIKADAEARAVAE